MSQLPAALYAVICLGVILFQMCLIAGAPWGRLTQGGGHPGKLPMQGRIAAGFSIVLLLAMGASILSVAGHWPHWPVWTGWAALAMTTVSTILNLITPSQAERRLWAPITLLMLGLALTVMLAARQ